jgi:hypothetical protein
LGLYPKFTRAALQSKKIQHEHIELADGTPDLEADPQAAYLKVLSDLNKLACDILDASGYRGNLLRMRLPVGSKDARKKAATLPHTRERQDAIANSKTQGQLFIATGGSTLNDDDVFISMQRTQLLEDIAARKVDQKERVAAAKRERIALEILEAEKSKLTSDDLKNLIAWKTGKPCPSKVSSVADRLALWNTLKRKAAPQFAAWGEAEQLELDTLENKVNDLVIEDTGLARTPELQQHTASALLRSMTEEERNDFLQKACCSDTVRHDPT